MSIRARNTVTESQTQRATLDYLAAKRIWHTRQNSGAIRDVTGRPVRFGRPGMADILAIQTERVMWESRTKWCWKNIAQVVWLEIKSPVGKQSAAQKEFQAEVEAEGHTYVLVRDINDVIKFFE